jgi:hypothetical protein
MILYPVARKLVIDYLLTRDELDGVDVLPRIPAAPRPSRFVVISTAPASGPKRRVLSTRRIIAGGWAEKDYQAGLLTETVRALIQELKYARLGVRDVDIVGEPAEFPHPDITDRVRWQVTADLLVRANIV